MAAGTINTLTEFLAELEASGAIADLLNDPAAQFGEESLPYEGARLWPERLVPENMYKETQLKYRSFLAHAGSYYSPSQLSPTGELVGSFNVELGKTDQADQVTAQDYKNLMTLLSRKQSREAILAAIRWFDYHILKPHLDLNEAYRWQAALDAQVVRLGSNGYVETVDYPNPDGHRPPAISSGTLATPLGWYDQTASYDPFEDIFAIVDLLDKKGLRVNRIITGGRKLLSVMSKNPTVRERTSRITINASGAIDAQPGRATSGQINSFLAEDGIPPFEIYRKTYHTRADGEKLYIPDNKIAFLCSTGRTEPVDLGSRGVLTLENILGYFAIGTTAQSFTPGRTINIEEKNLYPGGYMAECIQVGLPVTLNPDAIAVLTINPPQP